MYRICGSYLHIFEEFFVICIGHQQPELKYLHRYVRGSVGMKWHDLGIELLDSNDYKKLDIIEAEHPTDLSKCCTKMFNLWLQKQLTASWNQLIEALRQPGIELDVLASNIEQMLLQGMFHYVLIRSLVYVFIC